jgi:ketosteroid isomerase-like protein
MRSIGNSRFPCKAALPELVGANFCFARGGEAAAAQPPGRERQGLSEILGTVSQENVEIVRRGYEAFAREGIEGVIPFFTEDAVIYSIPEWPDDPEYYGHDGLRKLDRQWAENFDEFGFDVRELHDAGDAVVSLHELTGRTKGSAVPMRMQIGAVFSEFRDGRIARQDLFSSWEAALEAAGVRE